MWVIPSKLKALKACLSSNHQRILTILYAGPSFGHYSRPLPQDAKLSWRALGFPKMAFVTIIFLCLALFLLVFSAGRMHAHKILRAMPLAPLAANPASALPMGVSIQGAIPGCSLLIMKGSRKGPTLVPEGLE